jgi:hypothetical protein
MNSFLLEDDVLMLNSTKVIRLLYSYEIYSRCIKDRYLPVSNRINCAVYLKAIEYRLRYS